MTPFAALSQMLNRTDSGAEWQARSPAIERLRKALIEPGRASIWLSCSDKR
jgi:hypothetical protein